MKTPYGLPIMDSCSNCHSNGVEGFCKLPEASWRTWSEVHQNATYPDGTLLFVQDQPARGIFVICLGQVKLYCMGPDGRTTIYRVCNAGDVLGLSATLNGSPYEATAETLEPCLVSFVKAADVLRFVRSDPEIAFRVAQQLSSEVRAAWSQIQTLTLSHKAMEKLARLLLLWASDDGRVATNLTHEEIAEMLGLSRETVTRSFSEFKERGILRAKGAVITIVDRNTLLHMAGR